MTDDQRLVADLLQTIVERAETIATDRIGRRGQEGAGEDIMKAVERLRAVLKRHELA